jgi:hypothetical protein
MPELPEVETIVRGLRPKLEGRRLVRVQQRCKALRFPLPEDLPARLEGRRVRHISRRAKYIQIHFDDGQVLLCHLGMSGRFVMHDGGQPLPALDKHDHIILTTDQGTEIRFNDARRFGMMDVVRADELEGHKLLRDLGPEPLGNDFSGPGLAAALRGRRREGGPKHWHRPYVTCCGAPLRPVVPVSGTTFKQTASSAISSTSGPSTDEKARPARIAAAIPLPPAAFAASHNQAGLLFSVPAVSVRIGPGHEAT